jgi:hypothetical protein
MYLAPACTLWLMGGAAILEYPKVRPTTRYRAYSCRCCRYHHLRQGWWLSTISVVKIQGHATRQLRQTHSTAMNGRQIVLRLGYAA